MKVRYVTVDDKQNYTSFIKLVGGEEFVRNIVTSTTINWQIGQFSVNKLIPVWFVF